MQPAIEIRGVEKSFGAVRALAGVDLSVGRGEALALLGPNGAGKSTLINVVAGLSRADAGAVSVLGHDVVREYRAARRALGVVPQELVFDPFFEVREVLRLQAGYFGLGREQDAWVDELLATLGLTNKAGATMRTLSGGMKRRVLIAQALVHRPDVVVLDEPTAGVDVEMRGALYRLCERLLTEGRTIVLVTHHFEEAEALCQRMAVLVKGRIVALDTKQRLTSGKGGLEAAVMDLVRDGTSGALPGLGQDSEGP
jgi:ABC-2 type transport system ATP-binding protein